MIKTIALLVVLTNTAWGHGGELTVLLKSKSGKGVCEYMVVREPRQKVRLIYRQNGLVKLTKVISSNDADAITHEATDIVWRAKYRAPASSSQCMEYVTIRSQGEEGRVCSWDIKAIGRSYGLLKSLEKRFNSKKF